MSSQSNLGDWPTVDVEDRTDVSALVDGGERDPDPDAAVEELSAAWVAAGERDPETAKTALKRAVERHPPGSNPGLDASIEGAREALDEFRLVEASECIASAARELLDEPPESAAVVFAGP